MTRSRGQVEYEVQIQGASPTQIDLINALVFQYTQAPDDGLVVRFFGAIAMLPYQSAQAARARQWVQDEFAAGVPWSSWAVGAVLGMSVSAIQSPG